MRDDDLSVYSFTCIGLSPSHKDQPSTNNSSSNEEMKKREEGEYEL